MRKALVTIILVTALPGTLVLAEQPPAWLRQAAASGQERPEEADAIILLDEQRVDVQDNGKVTTTHRYAVRIFNREARHEAAARQIYRTDSSKIRRFKAWLIHPQGKVKEYGNKQTLDLAYVDNDVYNEVRLRAILASDDILSTEGTGAVFGFEGVVEDRSVFTQYSWTFQEELPTIASRLILNLPEQWRADSVTFNHADIEPTRTGTIYTWELRDLPAIELEPASPPLSALAPRIAVNCFPPSGHSMASVAFERWKDVSRWLSGLADSQAQPTPEIAAKARELTYDAESELDRLRAIGDYVQSINYVSIQTNIGQGGGYTPHAAGEIFAKSYGDCKDKATLMRAMLRTFERPSYMVSIYSGDPSYVRPEWPSPRQFNHAVIAIPVSDETQAASIIEHKDLGRLLIFDPTSDIPVGDLPEYQQGSLALVLAGDQGALLKMPTVPAIENRTEREVTGTITPQGHLTARIRERYFGQEVSVEKRHFDMSKAEYAQRIEGWITRGVPRAKVSTLTPLLDAKDARFTLDVEFSAARYAQVVQGALMILKPVLVSRRKTLALTAETRRLPVLLNAAAFQETTRLQLPAGYLPEELPEEVDIEEPFGSYSAGCKVEESVLKCDRSLVVQRSTLPPEDYPAVRGFLERIREAEQAPVVLVKQ